ncbi:MAG: TIGR02757 family protein [Sandaracinus sp.]|nr:TIGR02757 family protein [Sandaracinus sp.]MCB9614701.1 TIGR02757 family protein [Sandaracinus sp.]MCB9632327.1 TIGR02757 family protein [Sandaracinus sp.]
MRESLDALIRTSDVVARRATDPVDFVHRYDDPNDQEVVGLVAATLAFGNVVAVRRSVARVLDVLGPTPHRALADERVLKRKLRDFVHRVYRGPHVARMLASAGRLRGAHGTLGDAFAHFLVEADATEASSEEAFREGLARFADALRGPGPHERGLEHLVPDPRRGSACKRLVLYLRWMIRPADGVDLGLWPVSPARLVIPVDTHIHRIATNLGLTARADASWRTAREITTRLRVLDPADPVRYDFALCHLGVSRECPSRRDPERCEGCVLRPVCTRWR